MYFIYYASLVFLTFLLKKSNGCLRTAQPQDILTLPPPPTTTTSTTATTTTAATTTTTTAAAAATTTTAAATTTTTITPTSSTSTTSSTTTTTCTTTTTTPIPCVCAPGDLPIFISQDVPSAYNFDCPVQTPTKTCATGTGQFECFVGSTTANPGPFCAASGYAFSVLNNACPSFTACDSSGTCYTPYNPGSVVRYRFAPYCNGGLCCVNIFIENGGPGLNTGLISSTGTIYDHNNQYSPPLYGGAFLPFTCTSSGPFVINIDYVSCNGPPPPPTPCVTTG